MAMQKLTPTTTVRHDFTHPAKLALLRSHVSDNLCWTNVWFGF